MPIRFRCAYCNQLLGIARRKAGTVVRCPTCAGQVVVPSSPDEGKPEEPIFERNDFAEVLNPAGLEQAAEVSQSTAAGPPPGAWKPQASADPGPQEFHVPPGVSASPGTLPPGIFLSPAKATLVAVLFIFLLALTFVAGLLVGRLLRAG